MAAIITDQLRILNAANFRAGIASTANNYYVWVGLPNATDVESVKASATFAYQLYEIETI